MKAFGGNLQVDECLEPLFAVRREVAATSATDYSVQIG
jgi:hypothetical protein